MKSKVFRTKKGGVGATFTFNYMEMEAIFVVLKDLALPSPMSARTFRSLLMSTMGQLDAGLPEKRGSS